MIRRMTALLPLFVCIVLTNIAWTQTNSPVSVADVLTMTQVGLSDQIIIAKIHQNGVPSNLTTDDLVRLKKGKVSDAVIAALINPTSAQPASVVVQSPLIGQPSGATVGLTGDPNDPMSPHDSGIYIYTTDHDGKPKMVELERTAYQGAKTGGLFTSALTYGIAKAKSKAIIPGNAASIRVGDPKPVFYFYFDEKAAGLSGNSYFAGQNLSDPNQFALIRLDVEKNSRQAEIGEFSMWGASSGANKKNTVLFTSERIKPGLYRVEITDRMKSGEYCFISAPIATSSYAGMAGTSFGTNLFDFGVDD